LPIGILALADRGGAVVEIGALAGPETIPDELVDHGWGDRIRAA